jgi:hypothetical protein
LGEGLSATNVLAGTGILRNPPESSGILSKYRNSCPHKFLRKIPVKSKKNGIPVTPPKTHSCEKFLRKTQEKKEILRNPVRNGFLDSQNKFLKTGICNLGLLRAVACRQYWTLEFSTAAFWTGG